MLGLVASGRTKWGNDKTQMISKKCIMFLGRKNKPNLYGGKKRKMPMLMASGKTKNENNKMISCTNANNIKGIGKLYLLMVSLEGAGWKNNPPWGMKLWAEKMNIALVEG